MVGLQTKPDSDIKAEHKVLTIALHIPVSPAVCLSLSYTNKTDTHAVGVEGTRAWYDPFSCLPRFPLFPQKLSRRKGETKRQGDRDTEMDYIAVHTSELCAYAGGCFSLEI